MLKKEVLTKEATKNVKGGSPSGGDAYIGQNNTAQIVFNGFKDFFGFGKK